MEGIWIKMVRIFYLILTVIISSCMLERKQTTINKFDVDLNLKIISLNDTDMVSDWRDFFGLFYKIENNTATNIYFNKMNFMESITDTNGTVYPAGYFKILNIMTNELKGYSSCKAGIDFDIYPMTRKDTINNIVKINAHSYYADTLRPYGYDYLYDNTDKKDNLPLCFKIDKTNKIKVKFQIIYDNTKDVMRVDSIWYGILISNVAVKD